MLNDPSSGTDAAREHSRTRATGTHCGAVGDAHLRQGRIIDAISQVLIGARTATVKASTDLVCSGVTFWDFRPIVEENGVIGWKLLQTLIEIYRSERDGPQASA